MASVILTNWTIFYSDDAGSNDTGYKQIRWTGAGAPATNTNTVNQLYSAIADLFSIAAQNNANDTIPMKAITPTVYQIGAFDAGDLESWFIDPDSVKHLTGGSLETISWTRVQDSNAGIVKVPYTVSTTQFVNNDRGRTVTHNAGSTGTLLWFDTTTNEAWIRPTNSTSTHNWAMGGTNVITVTGGTGNVTQSSAPKTGERLWPNIYSIGTLEADTRLYVYQNFTEITNFWGDGHIDRLFLVNDGFASGEIDSGLLTIYARQYSKTYDHYVVDVSAGGANPIPLATAADINNTTGFRTFTAQAGTGAGTFTVGNYIYHPAAGGWSAATAKGVITAVAGTSGASSTPIITYYLIDDLTDFANGNTIKEYVPATGADGDASCTAATPSNVGPTASPSSTVTIAAGGILRDLNNGYGSAPYSIEVDLQTSVSVEEAYERLKYLTRFGQTTDIETETSQSLIGQAYTAAGDYYLPYDTGSIDNPFTEGETITATGGFTCTLTSKHDQGSSEGFIIVRNVRGTIPVDNTVLTGGTSGNTAQVDTNAGADPVAAITPVKVSPFGTFAGGTFFGARGVWLKNVPGTDAANYQLIDSENVSQVPPVSVTILVNGLVSGDRVSVFRALGSGDNIDKTYLASHATSNDAASTSFTITTTIPNDTPTSGYIRLLKTSTGVEQRIQFNSWSGSVFTLNSSHSGGYGVNDTAYVPYIDTTASGSSVSVSTTYAADRYLVTRVRITGIVPYSISGQLTNTGYSTTAIRDIDEIVV